MTNGQVLQIAHLEMTPAKQQEIGPNARLVENDDSGGDDVAQLRFSGNVKLVQMENWFSLSMRIWKSDVERNVRCAMNNGQMPGSLC